MKLQSISVFIFLLFSTQSYSQEDSCTTFLGFWISDSVENGDTLCWDFYTHKDGVQMRVGNKCVLEESFYAYVLNMRAGLYLEFDSHSTDFSDSWAYERTDCNTMKLTDYDGSVIELKRIKGHRCDKEEYLEFISENARRGHSNKDRFEFIWIIVIYYIGAYVFFVWYFFNINFRLAVLKKWIPMAIVFTIFMWSSYLGVRDIPIIMETPFGAFKNSFFPYSITPDYNVPKNSPTTFIVFFVISSLFFFLPVAVWTGWYNVIAKRSWVSKIILWVNRATISLSAFVMAYAVLGSSILPSLDGAHNWYILIISFILLLYLGKKSFWDVQYEVSGGV